MNRVLAGVALTALLFAALTAATAAQARNFQTLYTFTGGADGGFPSPSLFQGGVGYGTTSQGGTGCGGSGCGLIFAIDTTTHAFTTVHAFSGNADGGYPGVAASANGLLYGATFQGGHKDGSGGGTVFALDPATRVLTTLHVFTGGKDGAVPSVWGLVNGVVYGSAGQGGTGCGGSGCGLIFAIDTATGTLTRVHSFTGGGDGASPVAFVFDNGIFYATTYSGGNQTCQCGTIFQVDTATQTLTTQYRFTVGAHGGFPVSELVIDGGTLYGMLSGTTAFDPAVGCSGPGCPKVYAFAPGSRALTVLHTFTGLAKGTGADSLVAQPGRLYGSTAQGGTANCGGLGCGTVFAIDTGSRKLTTLHGFTGGADGANPAVITFDNGSLYGQAGGGSGCGGAGCGSVFSVDPATGKLKTLHSFTGADGAAPIVAGVIAGTLYGTTALGGTTGCGGSGCGTLWGLVP